MGIFSVTHILRLLVSERHAFGETDAQLLREIIGDQAVVYGSMREYFVLQILLRFQSNTARFQLREHPFIIPWIDDDRHVLIIFRGGADHGGSADVDVLHRVRKSHAGL